MKLTNEDTPEVGLTYYCRLTRVEKLTGQEAGPYGDCLAWTWTILLGPKTGTPIYLRTQLRATSKNALGRLLAMLKGGPLEPTEEVNTDDWLGQPWVVTTQATTTGGIKAGIVRRPTQAEFANAAKRSPPQNTDADAPKQDDDTASIPF